MPLNIDNYSAWANAQPGEVAASLNRAGEGLADIKTTTGSLARFFKTSSFTHQREAVRADFQRALTERFGNTVATAVMQNVGTDLTASAIRHAVSAARLMAMRSALNPQDGQTFRLTDGNVSITQATINGMSEAGRTALTKFLDASNAAADLLGTTPVGDADLAEAEQHTDALLKELVAAKVSLQMASADAPTDLDPVLVGRLSNHCNTLVVQLQDHLAHVRDLNANGPMSQGSQDRFRDTWYDAFQLACAALKTELPDNAQAWTTLNALARTPVAQFGFVMDKHFNETLAARIESALARDCGANPLAKGTVKHALAKSYAIILNQRPWAPISKTFTAAQGGSAFQLTSNITPGKHVAGVGEAYPYGVNGFMCHSAEEKDHAVNLAVSSLSVQDAEHPNHTVFTGVRHGVHCAWELTDAGDRATANLNRAADAVKAAFSVHLAAHPNLQPGQEIRLPMMSVSLLTPECFRPIKAAITGNHSSDEKMMLREQTAAWGAVSARPMQIAVNGQVYTVKPEIATFNFGVNQGGVGALSGVIGGWGVSDPMNQAAMGVLKGRVDAFINDGTQPVDKRLAVQKIFNQVVDILNPAQERTDSHDAYKAAARIAVVTSLMDGVPCWNCKSGKDRTGEMDVECKFLATLVDRGLDIPELGAELTDEQKALFRTIALEGGNHEMQEYNTGIGGFKTGGVDSIPERLGGAEARTFHKGGADFVGV